MVSAKEKIAVLSKRLFQRSRPPLYFRNTLYLAGLFFLLLIGVSCSRREAEAKSTKGKASYIRAKVSGKTRSFIGSLVPKNSIASVLPASKVLGYVSIPDVAASAFALKNSPLKSLWESPQFVETLQKEIGEKAWLVMKEMASHFVEGKWRGPLEVVLAFEGGGTALGSLNIYISWQGGQSCEEFVRSLIDCVVALREKVPELGISERAVGGGSLWVFSVEGRPQVYFGTQRSTAKISTDERFFQSVGEVSSNLLSDLYFKKVSQRLSVGGTALGYVYLPARAILEKLTARLPLPPMLLEKIGIKGLQAVGFATHQWRGQVREAVFALWPQNERGILSSFLKSARIKAALSLVPDDCVSFSVGAFDLSELYKKVMALLRDFGLTGPKVETQLKGFENAFGVSLEDLLKAFGTDFITYNVVRKGVLSGVAVFSLRNSEKIKQFMQNLGNRMGRQLLVESVQAVPLFSMPGPVPTYVAVCEHHIAIGKDLPALRDFVKGRNGRADSVLGRPQIAELIKKKGVAGLSYVRLDRELAAMSTLQLGQGSFPFGVPGSFSPSFFKDLGRVGSLLPSTMGDLWCLAYLPRDGVIFEMRSNYGVGPLVFTVAAVGGTIFVPSLLKERKARLEKKVVEEIRSIVSAQQAFKAKNGRYAQNLWELGEFMLIDRELARGFKHDYLFKVRSSGIDMWHVEARPVDDEGRFFYCDQTGVIRAEKGKPASSDSPVAVGMGR